ncbi:MAG TPA: GGDEF domain-containing protein [Solirubrobacteraceae bacterium]|jgi:diguanylate cyclase (GGDEF)-like protein|nr:GGDEF domain-containing protein [Solirubrobacteraceae bacterium]
MASTLADIPGAAPDAGGVDADSLIAAMRRLALLAEGASEPETIFRALARELFSALPVAEVHVHHLRPQEDLVVTYLHLGEGRITYAEPLDRRPPGVAWVAGTGQGFLARSPEELAASLPRLYAIADLGSALLLPLRLRGEVEAVIVLARPRPEAITDPAARRAATLVDQAATALALLRARAEAGTDPVTGCMNHRAMRRRLQEEIGRATRTDGALSCLLLDLDDFKLVNDRHGHQAGDTLLREVSGALMGEFRAFDRVARYGGDEFVVILAGADLHSAAGAADRARERLLGISTSEDGPGVSASFGVAQWSAPMTVSELLEACDAALLRSKREGKGRVTRAAA